MRFSFRVDLSEPNPIAAAETHCRREGMPLGKLNDSNPTRHGLAPALVPGTYTADPRGPRPAREALASFLTELHRGAEGAGTAPAADPNRLYLLSSTSQAYSWLMKLLCDAGDAVLAPKPGYPVRQPSPSQSFPDLRLSPSSPSRHKIIKLRINHKVVYQKSLHFVTQTTFLFT